MTNRIRECYGKAYGKRSACCECEFDKWCRSAGDPTSRAEEVSFEQIEHSREFATSPEQERDEGKGTAGTYTVDDLLNVIALMTQLDDRTLEYLEDKFSKYRLRFSEMSGKMSRQAVQKHIVQVCDEVPELSAVLQGHLRRVRRPKLAALAGDAAGRRHTQLLTALEALHSNIDATVRHCSKITEAISGVFQTTWQARLTAAREAAGLTTGQLADKAGISINTVKRYEQGKCLPQAQNAARIAKALNSSIQTLFPELRKHCETKLTERAALPEWSKAIWDARIRSNMTRPQLAEALGVHKCTVEHWELQGVPPSSECRAALNKLLGIDVAALLAALP